MRSTFAAEVMRVDGWILELWHGSPWDQFGDRSEPEKIRISSADELRERVLAARSDRRVARYECSRYEWEDLCCPAGHPVEFVKNGDFRRCTCRRSHHVYRCRHCATDCYNPPHEAECKAV